MIDISLDAPTRFHSIIPKERLAEMGVAIREFKTADSLRVGYDTKYKMFIASPGQHSKDISLWHQLDTYFQTNCGKSLDQLHSPDDDHLIVRFKQECLGMK